MRVCFAGDSHVGALRAGWNLVQGEYPNVTATFFGAPSEGVNYLAVEDGKLVPKTPQAKRYFEITSGGQTSMAPGDYDRIVIVSLGYSMMSVLNVYLTYRSDAHRNEIGEYQLVSAPYFDEMARSGLERALALRIRDPLAAASGTKVWNCPKPMPCLHALHTKKPSSAHAARVFEVSRQALACGDMLSLGDSYARVVAQLRKRGVELLGQSEETLETPAFTNAAYGIGGRGLHPKSQATDDGTHMNAQYGVAMLRVIFAKMRVSAPAD